MLQDLDRLGPILAVMATAGLILVADLMTPRDRKKWLSGLAIAGLAASALWLVVLILRDRQASFFSDTMALDNFSIFFTFLFIGVSGAVILASLDYAERFGERQGEFFALVLIATSGMMLLSGARDLVTIFVSLELTSITQFVLAGFLRDDNGSEAALKYLLLGAVASAVILYGMAFLFGISGTTRLISTDGRPEHRQHDRQRRRRHPLGADREHGVPGRRLRLQDGDRAVPDVDARRVPGRADAGRRVPLGRQQGRGVRRRAAHLLRGLRAEHVRRRRLEVPVRRARGDHDDRRQRDGAAADEHPPHARLQLDRAGR